MKIELSSLRSWWLATAMLWAVAIWIATLFGLGGRIPAAADGERSASPLPALPAAAPERIASAEAYAQIGARPLFAEDRKPRPYLLGGSELGASSAVSLTGVLLTADFSMAILTTDQKQSLRLRLNGEPVNGWQLLALEPRSATVSGPGGTQTLELTVFNGQGGEPPTVLGNPVNGAVPPAGAGVTPLPMAAPQAARPAQATVNVPGPAPAPPPAPAAHNAPAQGPSDAQMQAIRARIQARRQQLQQQQQPSQRPPTGGSGQNN
ncbi:MULTISPECIES: general secretion pathway protein GspN [unclassified Stenotrophomonas]|uniref:general secretion pathway protein GspN n=1 Tax=unclassified Stenotrophomonas TaxID=196198 RepID=UPI002117F7FE|nr:MULTISPECIES: general secretion pathway protein GspN [unclassified Stenotrophomonas]